MNRTITDALMRTISRSLTRCELVHVSRQPLDLALAASQHSACVAALESAGVRVTILPEEPELPDAAFVEDTAVVLDEAAILCRPAAASRQPEIDRIATNISKLRRSVHRIAAPGTLEGGDVLRVGRTLFVGISSRTNREGLRQLDAIVRPLNYHVIPVPVEKCLHLKTAATSPAAGVVLVNRDWVDASAFAGCEVLTVPAGEPWAANTLTVNGKIFTIRSAPRTADLLRARGWIAEPLDISELQKAEAGLTCLSLLFEATDEHR